MNDEANLLIAVESPDLEVVTGSRAYGTARYSADGLILSDLDIRGFTVPPFAYLIGLKQFNEMSLEGDHKIWSLKNFLDMLVKGNMQVLECLFMPPELVRRKSEIGELVLAKREMFVSKNYYRSACGFASSEWYKVKGVKRIPVERKRTENEIIDAFRNEFKHLPKDKWDQILEIAYSEHKMKEIACKSDVGEKRKLEYDRYGYSVTGAHHALRLLFQCDELLKTGFMTFPRPEAILLSDVKRGKQSYEEVEAIYDDLNAKVKVSYDASSLPERCDPKPIMAFYRQVVEQRIGDHYLNPIRTILTGYQSAESAEGQAV